MDIKIQDYHGSPAIVIDGKPLRPMFMTASAYDRDYIKKLGDAGIRVFFIGCSIDWDDSPRTECSAAMPTPDKFESFKEQCDNIFELIPDAYVFMRMNLTPTKEWMESHPDELLTYNDGKHSSLVPSGQ